MDGHSVHQRVERVLWAHRGGRSDSLFPPPHTSLGSGIIIIIMWLLMLIICSLFLFNVLTTAI